MSMFTFTDTTKPNLTVLCICGRKFIPEEFYCCTYCSDYYCRFCTLQEIESYFCKNCNHTTYPTELRFKNHCNNCFECPLCRNVL